MNRDGITEEIREIRHQLAARFDNDVDRIGADLRRREAESGRRIVRLPRRQPRHASDELDDARESAFAR
jgi:hypothetical protein